MRCFLTLFMDVEETFHVEPPAHGQSQVRIRTERGALLCSWEQARALRDALSAALSAALQQQDKEASDEPR